MAVQQAQLDVEKEQLALQEARLAVEFRRLELAFETAVKMVERLRPDVDGPTKAMAIQTLLPNLLQLGNSNGLELALPTLAPAADQGGT